jgi:epsilon-lactone hydrolase
MSNIQQSRIDFEKLGSIYPYAENIILEKEVIEEIDCYWFRNKDNSNTNKLVLYLHGGCFVLGSVRSHGALVSHLAKELAVPFLFVEYSLAPEKPFPFGVNDVLRIYKNIKNNFPQSEIIVMGDSAGAGLSITLLTKIEEHGYQIPNFLVMISPWIDLSCANNSITGNANRDPVLNKDRLLELASFYIGNQGILKVNPKENLPSNFSPTLIIVGSNEILLDDSRFIHNKISKTQEKTKLSIYENQNHVWFLENIHSEQSKKAIQEIKTFLSF